MTRYALVALVLLAPQEPPQVPVFKAGVDLLVIDATVLDRSHRPITDLRPEDFRAQVDGKPHRVLFARYFGAEPAKNGEPAAPIAAAPGFVSNLNGRPGRTLVFAIDQESIEPGGEKLIFNASMQLLDALSTSDAVGLMILGGVSVDLSRDHERVRDALKRMTGTRPPNLLRHEVTYNEAVAIADRSDANALKSVVDRECPPSVRPNDPQFLSCQQEIRMQARDLMVTARFRAQHVLSLLENLFTQLKDVDGPKEIVLLSGGLPFDQELATSFTNASRKAAESRVMIHALQLDQAPFDGSTGRSVTSAYGGREMTQGLASIATMTGGSYYSAVSRATGVFDQIGGELNHFYELGIERQPGDVDHPMHHIELGVTRSNVTVRARPEIADVIRRPPTSDKLLALLRQPIDVAELPMEASHFTLRGEQAGSLKIILASELGASSILRAPVDWGYVVIDGPNVVANGRLRLDVASSPAVATANVNVPPGEYQVRIAAVDAGARGAVLQFPLHAQLKQAGDLEMSDLVAAPAAGNRLEPRATIVSGVKLVAMTEFYAQDPKAFDGVEVSLEVAIADPTQTLATMSMPLQPMTDVNGRVAQSIVNTELLDPGRYVLRTIAVKGGKELGRVERTIEIAR